MSDVTTHCQLVTEQVQQAAQITAEQQADFLAEAKKELGLVAKALRSGNRENAVGQYLAGLHGLRFINFCRKAGKAQSVRHRRAGTGPVLVAGQERGRQPDPQDLRRHQPPARRHHAPAFGRQGRRTQCLGRAGGPPSACGSLPQSLGATGRARR